ncbi:MAG TPA: FkbM family methyltransferase [Streptosporangiaceae bacterium]|nr:FkbM family methyltransferase [Streptosporangiaceae bacterium]
MANRRPVLAGLIWGEIAVLSAASEQVRCELRAISAMIDEHGIKRLDLLKIDAEKGELESLRGVRGEHWPMIGQVTVEVCVDKKLSIMPIVLRWPVCHLALTA